MLASFPDWVGPIATAVAAVGTVGTLIAALIQLSRQRTAAERRDRRGQAELISAWVSRRFRTGAEENTRRVVIELLNTSTEPVYRAIVYRVHIQGTGPSTGLGVEQRLRELHERFEEAFVGEERPLPPVPPRVRQSLAVIPPGRYRITVDEGWLAMAGRLGTELAFTDRAGRHWVRSADGALREIEQPPVDYYGLPAPYDWQTPDGLERGGGPSASLRDN